MTILRKYKQTFQICDNYIDIVIFIPGRVSKIKTDTLPRNKTTK
jgi:hypothetical protein